MQFTEDDLREFKEAYRAEYEEDLGDEAAREMAALVMRILEFMNSTPPT